jgi:hypothetical protein
LRDQIISHDGGQPISETVPRRRVAIHEALGQREVFRRPTFDCVRGQREGRAGKANQRNLPGKLALDESNRVERKSQRLARLGQAHLIDVGGGANRPFDRRPLALDEVEWNAHRLERQQQVGEENRCVEVDATNGLERDLSGQLRRPAQLQ